ncbi:MAG: hypothetical protein JO235_22275 [Chroococcidiopsidaceae cyanobacterium CP_BM_RX_35]|nr:hypothetical protein [Chroococcidiopsidaceae cyanobacterium CP_BM_RX_35]
MLRCFYGSATLSVILTLLAARVAFSSPTATVPQSPQLQNSSVDVPLCYMQTADGRIMDLQNLCRQTSPASPISNASSTVPSFRLDSRSGYASDSRPLEEREK